MPVPQQPRRAGVWRKEFNHKLRIEIHALEQLAASGQQQYALLVGDKYVIHDELLKDICR